MSANVMNGKGFHFEVPKASDHCPADVIQNGGCKVKESKEKYCPSSKFYNTLLEYCTDVADKLPQRQAFYVIDLADILWKVQEWKERLPRVDIFYAVKANTDPILLRLLSTLGLSFDCASSGEIQMVLDAGASPDNIIFAHTIKPVEELQFASEKGVALMTFDNEEELLKIHREYPGAKLVIRITPCVVDCYFDLSDKFGCNQEEAVRLLKIAKQLDLNVEGISFHVGALCDDPESYASTIRVCRQLFDKAQEIGFEFSILDIGGGFYGHTGTQSIFYKMADGINKALEEHFSDVKARLIAEPGTYIACSAFQLVSTVLGKRSVEKAGVDQPVRHYYVNDGVWGSFFKDFELYGIRPVPLLSDSEIRSRTQKMGRIFGQTCCSTDVLYSNIVLPELKMGERVIWENMGAYCLGVASTFCGTTLPIPKYVFIQDKRLNREMVNDKHVDALLRKYAVFIKNETHDM